MSTQFVGAAPMTSQRGCIATREKTPETFSLTNPARLWQKGRGPVPVLLLESFRGVPARATSPRTVSPSSVRKPRAHRSRCRSLLPCQTDRRCASSSRIPRRRGTSPCSARRELVHTRESPARSFRGAPSQSLPLAVRPILRRADEHLYKVVMQGVVELALEAPS